MAFSSQEPAAATENQDCPESFLPPLSPLMQYALMRNPPRISLSRIVSLPPPPPPALSSSPTVERRLMERPRRCFPDNRLRIRNIYLSRDQILKKMSQRFTLYRRIEFEEGQEEQRIIREEVELLGMAVDYFLTFPLKRIPPPSLIGEIELAWAIGPVKSTRDTLNRHPGMGEESIDGLPPFPWVADSTGTKMFTIERGSIDKFKGFVECEKCGSFYGIGYHPNWFFDLAAYFSCSTEEEGEDDNAAEDLVLVSRGVGFTCCCDGNPNPVSPFISDNVRRINWLGLFTGFGLAHCTMDQLMFYCSERKLEETTFGNSNPRDSLILRMCGDVSDQVLADDDTDTVLED